jgi:acetamidase/formamidase
VNARPFAFHYAVAPPIMTVRPRQLVQVFTEDAFCGKITTTRDKPREAAPFPRINPLTGPIAIEGVKTGDIVAVHLASLTPARDWGVATISPNFGALSGTRSNPNLQPEQPETVWIWRVDREAGVVSTTTATAQELRAPLRPFHGCLGVAPPHGDVRHSVVPDTFGGNLDIPDLGAGATLYLRSNAEGGLVYIGDGHYAQGDGELAGTAVEGALHTQLCFDRLPPTDDIEWPRIETDREIGVIGCARPVEDAARIASHGLIRWVANLCGLGLQDAHELVSQTCRLRIGNLVNPLYSVAAFIDKRWLPGTPVIFGGAHGRLAACRT